MNCCTKCGAKLVLKKQGRVVYSSRVPNLPYYTVNIYECPNAILPWPWTGHDRQELAETTEIYKIEKAKYDKSHSYPLPNPGMIIRKGI